MDWENEIPAKPGRAITLSQDAVEHTWRGEAVPPAERLGRLEKNRARCRSLARCTIWLLREKKRRDTPNAHRLNGAMRRPPGR